MVSNFCLGCSSVSLTRIADRLDLPLDAERRRTEAQKPKGERCDFCTLLWRTISSQPLEHKDTIKLLYRQECNSVLIIVANSAHIDGDKIWVNNLLEHGEKALLALPGLGIDAYFLKVSLGAGTNGVSFDISKLDSSLH